MKLSAGPNSSPPRPAPATPASAAAVLLEVVPEVMRTIRLKMRQATSADLTIVQFRSLALAAFQPGGATVSDVAEHIGLTMPSASKLVDGLVRRGYLRRGSDLNDRRISILGPTPKGRRALGAARRITRRHLADMLAATNPQGLSAITAAAELLRPIFATRPAADRPGINGHASRAERINRQG